MSIEERVIIEEGDTHESPSNTFLHRNRCCFHLPCFGPTTTTNRHITLGSGGPTSSSLNDHTTSSFWDSRWWARPFLAFKKIREWSEIVAGPKWKTFIRRLNRRRHNHHNNHTNGKFQYDPLSYALNFDEGPGQNNHFEEEYDGHFHDFSSRLAAVPLSSTTPPKTSVDLGNGAPAC